MLHKKQIVSVMRSGLNFNSVKEFTWHLHVVFFIALFFILTHAANAKEASHPRVSDIRVIVDISGSMKKTDPNNLRRPAIRLLAGLIPAGSRAGIWNFAKQVNMTVKIGTVNDAWRELARKQSKKINSVGLYTNIENAIRKVSFDWKKPDPRYKRNIILLTDGQVDVSHEDKLDKASRKRILKNILPALEKAQVKIHTIALSDNVDESLLSTLSAYTDGLHRKVDSADDLQQVFLQMLEQSASLDTLPIKDNRFNVDAGINDMTLLVFNKDMAHPTTIVTPAKKNWDKSTSTDQLKWFSDDGYDLITVKNPQQGQWNIMAPVDKNNRVVVVTNLKLKIAELPAYAMLGDVINVNAFLEEEGKALTDQRLLSKFRFLLTGKIEGSAVQDYIMAKSGAEQSAYHYQLPAVFKQGIHELVIKAESPTVEREVRHQFTVYATPASIKISKKQGNYEVKITPYTNILRLESVKINLELEDKVQHELTRHENDWVLAVAEKYNETMLSITINAIRTDGKPVTVKFSKMLAAHNMAQELKIHTKESIVKKDIKIEKNKLHAEKNHLEDKTKPSKDDVKKKSDNVEKKENNINSTFIIISIVIGNLFLAGLLAAGYFYMKRRKSKLAAIIQDELSENNEVNDKPEEEKDKKKQSKVMEKKNKEETSGE